MRFSSNCLMAVFFLFLLPVFSYAQTDRVNHGMGQGYSDITTNAAGDVVGETRYSDIGQKLSAKILDHDLHTVSEIEYRSNQPVRKTVKDAHGRLLCEDLYDDKGRIKQRSIYDDLGFAEMRQYQWDSHGVTEVSVQGLGGVIKETYQYSYDAEGRLRTATRYRRLASGDEVKDKLVLDEDGDVVERKGQTEGLFSGRTVEQAFLVSGIDEVSQVNGNRVRRKLNANGSYDALLMDPQGRVLAWQRLQNADKIFELQN